MNGTGGLAIGKSSGAVWAGLHVLIFLKKCSVAHRQRCVSRG
jgi:hypothetical protein